MMVLNMSEIPEDLKYTEEHEWVEISDGKLKYGITDHAQDELGDIVYVELPEEGEEVGKGDIVGVIESVKAVSDLYVPATGKILEVNEELETQPELINEDPYGEGWIAVIDLEDESEITHLMNASEYENILD